MRLEIAQLHERLQATLIYVTHDQTEAMTLGTRIVVMKDGVIQQVDTPQNLYGRPANLFVAGFIGTPQMNFLNADVVEENGRLALRVGSSLLELPESRQGPLKEKGYAGREITFGIRPEDIRDSEIIVNMLENSCITAKIQVYELLGAEALLYFEYAGYKVTASVHARTKAREGDMVRLAFDMEKSYLFDKETGQSIL